MGRPRKEQPVTQVEEQEEEPVTQVEEVLKVVDKSTELLKEIGLIEKDLKQKKKEYSEYIASKRKEVKTPSLAEYIKLSRRDDLNSDRRELKKVTAMAMDKLKKSR